MSSGNATVKAVLSGDTLLLVGRAVTGPPPEITITLANLQAPRPARGPSGTDEPFAWGSREFLRRMVIGKSVSFRVVQSVPNIGRNFGDIELDGVNISLEVVRNGWASVKESRDPLYNSAVYEQLTELETLAKQTKLGIFTDDASLKSKAVRSINWSPSNAEVEQIYNTYSPKKGSGSTVRVVIEYVRDGGSLRCYHMASSTYITVALTGVICPRLNSPKAGESEAQTPPEPFAMQARHFTELRLLHRELDLAVDGLDSRGGSLLATVLHPKGNVAVELLRNGLARVADLSLVLLSRELAATLREAEREAREQMRCLWTDSAAESNPTGSSSAGGRGVRTFLARVVEVVSADTVIVVEIPAAAVAASGAESGEAALLSSLAGDSEELRLSLSSIRVPKLGQVRGGLPITPDEPFAREGKEFLRTRLVGSLVSVSIEYYRTFGSSDKNAEAVTRAFGSVLYNPSAPAFPLSAAGLKTNIAEQLVAAGLARVVRHRQGEDRSQEYDELLRAEQSAVEGKKGLHNESAAADSSTSRPISRVNDASTDSKKAKALFPGLSRSHVHKAVVEHVFTGSRFKVVLPGENVAIQLSLSQVRAPHPGRATASSTLSEGEPGTSNGASANAAREAEPCAERSRKFARYALLQRTVEVEIDDVDKNGVMLGKLRLLPSSGASTKKTVIGSGAKPPIAYSVGLVQCGLAKLDKYALEKSFTTPAEAAELTAAQTLAKEQKAGLWEFHKEEAVVEVEEETEEGKLSGAGLIPVRISEIVDGTSFYLQLGSGEEGSRNPVDEMMSVFSQSAPPPALLSSQLKRGLQCAALYDDMAGGGPRWFRVKVENLVKGTSPEDVKAAVLYIDYGNRETVPVSRLGELPPSSFAPDLPPQAIACSLAFVRSLSVTTELGRDAGMFLSGLTWGKALNAQILWKDTERGDKSGSGFLSLAGSVSYVALFGADSTESVNEKMVSVGLARISETAVRRSRRGLSRQSGAVNAVADELLSKLHDAEDNAHRQHLNMWAYGDPGGSDDEDSKR